MMQSSPQPMPVTAPLTERVIEPVTERVTQPACGPTTQSRPAQGPRRSTARRAVLPVAAALAAILVAACVSDEPRDRPLPKQPDWAKPSDLLVSVSFPEDTDGNGYLDTTGVTAYVFDEQYPLAPIQVPGAFSFILLTTDGVTLARWDMSAQETTAAVRPMRTGPGYVFRLNLLDKGGDRTDARNAELVSVFTPVTGKPVRAKSLTVTLGRAGVRPPAP